jgi:hypothetical protein
MLVVCPLTVYAEASSWVYLLCEEEGDSTESFAT